MNEEIVISYSKGMAKISGALNKNGTEKDLKGLKKKLQDKAKSEGYYGLEFWHFAEYKDHEPGELLFEILDPYGRCGKPLGEL